MSLLPCKSCPWRVDQDAVAVARVRPRLKASNLKRMVGEEDGFRPVMQCHGSPDDHPRICAGYLVAEGMSNINVRILLARDKIASPSAVLAACEDAGVKLHRPHSEVLSKLSAAARRVRGQG